MLLRVLNRVRMYRLMFALRGQLRNWRDAWRRTRTHSLGGTLQLKNGLVIRGDHRDDVAGIFKEIFLDRCYTPPWFYRPEPGDTVLDVGANIGLFCLYLSSVAPGIRIFAFEPHPETFNRLRMNLAENRLEGSITAHQLAVGRRPGEVHLSRVDGLDSGHECAIATGLGDAVRCIGLSEALELAEGRGVDLLKVDTEGAEAEIIAFAPVTVWSRITRVVAEYHGLSNRDKAIQALERGGYECRVEPTRGFEQLLGLVYARRP